ncbi:hypothetical protein [Pseudomonas mediterranea]
MNVAVNWIAAYNRLFALLDRKDEPTHYSGGNFLRTIQQVDPGGPSYEQLIPQRQSQGKSTSRKSYYWDVIQELPEQQWFQLYRVFIDELHPHTKDEGTP